MATRQKSKRTTRRSDRTKASGRSSRATRTASSRTRGTTPRRAPSRRTRVARQQPETLRLRSVMPNYTVSDIERTVAWYRDGLGFTVAERWEEGGTLQGIMLKAGSCTFGFSQDDFAKGQDREKGTGFRIYAETVQDIDALAERIRAYGGKIVAEPADMSWGARTFTVEDPDGFKISFSKSR